MNIKFKYLRRNQKFDEAGFHMSEDFEEKFKEYMKQLKSAKSIEEVLKILNETKVYLMGAIDIQTNFSLKFVGYYIIHQLELLEALFTFTTDINQKLTNLEERKHV
jgi:hypothetical protein